MVGTMILGATFKTSMSSHKADFARAYPDRVITKKISSNTPTPTKAWLPNTVCIPIFSVSQSENIKLLITPSRNHKSPVEHLQDETRYQNYNETETYFPSQDYIIKHSS